MGSVEYGDNDRIQFMSYKTMMSGGPVSTCKATNAYQISIRKSQGNGSLGKCKYKWNFDR